MKTGRTLLKLINLGGFMILAYFYSVILFRFSALKNGAELVILEFPVPVIGRCILPTSLWNCVAVSLGTLFLSFVCACIRGFIGPLALLKKESSTFKLMNLELKVKHKDEQRRRKTARCTSLILFIFMLLFIVQPAVTAGLIEIVPFGGTLIFDFTSKLSSSYFQNAGLNYAETIETSLFVTKSVIHQCVLFLSAYWFFCNLRRKQIVSAVSEKN